MPNKHEYQELRIYPELEVSVEVQENRDENNPRKLRVSAWGIICGRRKDIASGNTLIVVAAKSVTINL